MADPSKPREFDQEVEVVPAIRHEDAEWKLIQQNTFTRWVNNHLKKSGQSIANLETDFADGLRLICLAEALSHKRVGRYNKKVNFRSQKLENVSLALGFFQNVEHIKIVNIDSTHIVDHNKKLILGLIWALILHYSISMGWISEPRDGQQQDDTPKQKLLNWIRGRLPPGLPLTNFTSDWNDGIALSSLVDSMAPGSIPNWESLHPSNALENTEVAMGVAKDKLGVEPLITPEELIHPEIDEMSVMTYLSQFPATAPIPAAAPARPTEIEIPSVFAQIENMEEHPIVNHITEFEIICSEGCVPHVTIVCSGDKSVPVKIVQNGPGRFTIEFIPTQIGPHFVHISVELINGNGELIPTQDQPTQFTVVPAARLCPYNDTVRVGEPVEFRVEDALHGPVEIVIVDAEDVETSVRLTESLPSVWTGSFTPRNKGLHSVNVFYRKAHLNGSPFPLRVQAPIPTITVWGRGVEPEGTRIGDSLPVTVKSSLTSPEEMEKVNVVVVNKATGRHVSVHRQQSPDKQSAVFLYTPMEAGEHEVSVVYENQPIHESRSVSVSPRTSCPVTAFGPGLEGGMANQESVFQVNSHGDLSDLGFFIQGPSKADILVQETGSGAAIVSYKPTEPGIYTVKVLAGGEHIRGSPFVVKVDPADPKFHPAAARLSGLDKPYYAGEKVSFNIDTKRTNVGDTPEITILDKDHNKISHSIHEVNPCLHTVEFLPTSTGNYYLDCRLRGVALPGCPFTLDVKEPIDINKLRMYGPGIEGPVVAKEPTHFVIDAKQAGPGAVEVALCDRNGQAVDIDVLDHQDGSFTVKYTAPRPGAYQLNVIFAGEEISPIEINVKPRVDTSGITVSGLENTIVTVHCEKEMHVFTTDGENTRIVITSPSGRVVEAIIEETPTGLRVRFTPSEKGDYRLSVTYQDIPIGDPTILHAIGPDEDYQGGERNCAEAEYLVSGSGPAQPERVVVSGPGLGPVAAQSSTYVIIDTSAAGFGDIDLFVDGPTRTPVHCTDNQDGTLTMHYVPKAPGLYWLRVMFNQQHIPGSPFQVVAVGPSLLPTSLLIPDMEKPDSPFTSLSSGSSSQRTTPVV